MLAGASENLRIRGSLFQARGASRLRAAPPFSRRETIDWVVPMRSLPSSRVVDRDAVAPGVADLFDVGAVRCDDGVVAAHGSFGHRDVDGVVEAATADQYADCSGLGLGQGFDPASLEESGEVVLRTAAPGLAEHAGRNGRGDATGERGTV